MDVFFFSNAKHVLDRGWGLILGIIGFNISCWELVCVV